MDRGAWWLQSMGLQRVGYDLATKQQHVCVCVCTYISIYTYINVEIHHHVRFILRNVGLVQHLKINQCNLLINWLDEKN